MSRFTRSRICLFRIGLAITLVMAVGTSTAGTTARLESKTVTVGGTYTTVGLSNTYTDPVVVCTAQYENNAVPIVTRVSNAGGTSFDVRLQNPGDLSPVVAETVHCLIVEAGAHTIDGHNVEAQHYSSTVTDHTVSWVGTTQTYSHVFSQPVVIGQVMTQNDARWSVFWDRGNSRAAPPSATTLLTGKTVAGDPDTTRLGEEVGFIVFEAGHGMMGGVEFEAGVGPKTVSGIPNGAPHIYTFATPFPAAPEVAVSTMAGVYGTDGGWAQLFAPPAPATASTLQLFVDEDQIGDAERSHTTERVSYVVFATDVVFSDADCPGGTNAECDDLLYCTGDEVCDDVMCQPSTGDPCAPLGRLCDEEVDACLTSLVLRMETFALAGIDDVFQTVEMFHEYVSPVVVCDAEYETNTTPIVVRLDNVSPTGFDIKLQSPSSGPVSPEDVDCIVVEEGTWQSDGVRFEAQKYDTAITDRKDLWVGQAREYNQAYLAPTVIGQVMSFNDTDFSVYWQQGGVRNAPPSSAELKNGKTVLEDTDTTRATETIGFIVFESGHGPFLGATYEAATGPDSAAGVVNGAPFPYVFASPFDGTPQIAVTSMAGVDGNDGAWSQRHAASPSMTPTTLNVSCDEDLIGDAERSHTTEQVSYVVLDDLVTFPAVDDPCTADSNCPGFADFCDGPDTCVNGGCVKGQPPCGGEACNEALDACASSSVSLETVIELSVGDANDKRSVTLLNTFDSPVVACTVQYANNALPVVPRVGAVTGTGFELWLQNPGDTAVPAPDNVHCLVVEEGVWDRSGVRFEAHKYTTTVTDRKYGWVGQSWSYGQNYASPVVLGQVMSCNDPLWSVYWQAGGLRTTPPGAGSVRNGMGVLEDANTARLAEEIGFIVFEEGSGTVGGVLFEAFVTDDFVKGVTEAPPYTHPLTAAFAGDPEFAVVSGAGLDGRDGHWPYLYGATPIRQTEIDLAVDEDQIEDPERSHTNEQVMGIVFEKSLPNLCGDASPICDDGNSCTDDSCDMSTGCVNTHNTASCDDGNPCTGPDICSAGVCGGSSLDHDEDLDGVFDCLDNCVGVANPSQLDQDLDGEGDGCDPGTYDFESDTIGQRPAGVTQDGGANATLLVRNESGDLGIRYDGGIAGVHDTFDRLPAWLPFQDIDLYLDSANVAEETLTLELWSEGTEAEDAGDGLRIGIEPLGRVLVSRRDGDTLTELGPGVSLVDTDRLRLRLRKGARQTSRLFVDRWNGAAWAQESFFDIGDDHQLIGRGVAIVNQGSGRRPLLRITGVPIAPIDDFVLNESFDGLQDWKLFQRGPAGDATIPLAFSYRSAGEVRLEARLVDQATGLPLSGFDFPDQSFTLPEAPGGASDSRDLVGVPGGGNYDLEARLVDPGSLDILGQDGATDLAVGDVFIAAGQSNMAGTGSLDFPEPPVPEVHLFGNDYVWKQGSEPMDRSVDQVDFVNSGPAEHSLMLRFAKEVSSAIGVPVAIIPAALGATNLHTDWQRNPADPSDRGTLYGSSVHRALAQGFVHPIRGVVWYQGEADRGRGTAAYLADLQQLVADYRADLASPNLFFGNCQLATFALSDDRWLEIQEAQRQQAEADPLAAVVGLVDLPIEGIHLTTVGYQEAGVRLAAAVVDGSYGIAASLPPRLLALEFDSGVNQIALTYDKPITGGNNVNLFRVTDQNGVVGLNAVQVSGDTITLQLATPPQGSPTVSYGFGPLPTDGWIVAADGSGAARCFDKRPVQ